MVVDHFSGLLELPQLRHLDTKAVSSYLERLFKTFGMSENILSDGGPQFRLEFVEWCHSWAIVPERSSPRHLQSNAHAKRAMGQMKDIL